MILTDVFSAKRVAHVHDEVASNRIPYLGDLLFPSVKKMGLDISWFKTMGGLPVSLSPSAYDTVSTIRSREGASLTETQMAYFKESMIVKEKDEQDIMRVLDSNDPYAKEILGRVFNDANTLVDGAYVVPERMRMQLLSAANGNPSISIAANGATYTYNYDPNNEYKTNNYKKLSGTSAWTDTDNSDPVQDVSDAQDAVEEKTGSRPTKMIVSKATMNLLKKNAKIRQYVLAQNSTATVIMTDARVKEVFSTELNVSIIVYTKLYKDENGNVQKFFPDTVAVLIPDGTLGTTFFGVTPEERRLMGEPTADVGLVEGKIAVTVTVSEDPVQTKTTVSEVVLPSFERIAETFTIAIK